MLQETSGEDPDHAGVLGHGEQCQWRIQAPVCCVSRGGSILQGEEWIQELYDISQEKFIFQL